VRYGATAEIFPLSTIDITSVGLFVVD
jgi:hypothetical protein